MNDKENVLLNLRLDMPGLSPTLQKLGRFVAQHAERVLYMTITELARESQTSEASITRLCRHLGCKGFTEFKMALAFDIQQSAPVPVEGDRDDIATLIDECALSLHDTGKLVKRQDLATAAGLIHHARQVQIFGIAASATVGDYLHYKLMRLGIPSQAFTDIHSAAMNCISLTEGDVTLAISSSGSTRDVLYVVEQAKKRGSKIIVMSNTSRSPLANLADVVLVAAKPEGPFTAGALNSKVGVMLLVELVVMSLLKCDPAYAKRSQETASITLPMLL